VGAKTDPFEPTSLEFNFSNHDDVLHIVRVMQAKPAFTDAEEATQFAGGLQLFGEVLLKHRANPLFADLFNAFGRFMKKLKAN
jgi:hypothetical protein